jgi:dihydropyrimidine dehydrogenase (NAD+) subunit PreT
MPSTLVLHDATEALTRELVSPLTAEQAMQEADRCLECGGPHAPAPCLVACPAGIDVPGFVAAVAAGATDAAAATIFSENVLGGTCARVCPAEMLCEGACVVEEPIAIAALQRYAADAAFVHGTTLRTRAAANGRWVAVIGAGPAGLSCAGELAARGFRVTVFDERAEIGGLVRYAIAPYRQLREPLPAEGRLLERLGVEFRLHTPIESSGALRALVDEADAVFLGVGMGADADVRYPGDELPGVWESLPFIEAVKTGRVPEVGRRVIVVGGGNTAIDVARESVRLGADEVTLLYRRTRAEAPAYPHEIDEAENEGVRFAWLAAPVRFLGGEKLEGVECLRMRLGEADESGRCRPEAVAGSEFTLSADTVVKAIGQRPRTELADWLVGIDPDTGRTGNAKVFAGGDALNGGATVVEAVRDGKRAALAIDEWLRCAS